MPVQSVIRPVIRSVVSSVIEALNGLRRWVYSFDGVDDRALPSFKAINVESDIDISFRTGPTVTWGSADRTVVSQCLTATFGGATGKEFTLYFNAVNGGLQGLIGGNFTPTAVSAPLTPNSRYRWQLIGQALKVWFNDVLVLNTTVTRGTAREATAQTVVGAQTHGAVNTFRGYFIGQIFDMSFNGVLWPMADRNQSIQLPQPSGLGAELITLSVLENPVVKGSQWTYLGGGRWQFVGDGSSNELRFLTISETPAQGFLEFEVESYTGAGQMRVSAVVQGSGDRVWSGVGVKRWFYTAGIDRVSFDRNSGVVSCIIKNISFKPLLTTGASLVSNGDFAAVGPWLVGANSAITNAELQINSAAMATTRQPISTENSKDYLITYTIKSITSGAVRVLLYGNGTHYIGPDRTAAGTYTEIARFNTSGGSFTNSVNIQAGHTGAANVVVDNVSVLEITSLCNPLTLVNTNPDRWSEQAV